MPASAAVLVRDAPLLPGGGREGDAAPRAIRTDTDVHVAMPRAWALLRLGRTQGAEEEMASAASWLPLAADRHLHGALDRNVAELAWLQGRIPPLRQAVDGCLDQERHDAVPQYTAQLCAIGLRAEVDAALASTTAARDVRCRCDALLRRAEELDGMPLSSMPSPLATALARGEVARLGDPSVAATHWQQAAELAARWDDRYHEVYARWRYAEALGRAGSLEAALAAARKAHDTAATIGAAHIVGFSRDLVNSLVDAQEPAGGGSRGGRAAALTTDGVGSGSPGARARWGLTPRETEVLALLAEGRTNGQIAAALFIARKTASVHVSHILAKLGARTRTEAAAMALRAVGTTGA